MGDTIQIKRWYWDCYHNPKKLNWLLKELKKPLVDIKKIYKPWVYFVQCTETKRIKIGTTYDIDKRFNQLRVSSPTELKMLCAITNGGIKLEKALHQKYSHLKIHGEWFKGHKDIMDLIDYMAKDSQKQWIDFLASQESSASSQITTTIQETAQSPL